MKGLKSDMNQEVPKVIKIPTAGQEEEEFSFGAKKEVSEPIEETNPEEEESEDDVLTF